MRLDKYLCQNTKLTRSLAKKAISSGQVFVNLHCIKKSSFKVKEKDTVLCSGKKITNLGDRYLMLNKPPHYICSTQDEVYPSVLNLIDIEQVQRLHIVGRLDVDTTGLVLITDNGQWSHRVTAPKKKCYKTYQVDLTEEIDKNAPELFKQGILLKNETHLTLPAKLILQEKYKEGEEGEGGEGGEKRVLLSIQEGRYHQVKRMFAAIGHHVKALHRISVGHIVLDPQLNEGEWRYLTQKEISSIN